MDALEFLGWLLRAKNDVKRAQDEIEKAMLRVLERETGEGKRGDLDLTSYVNTALFNVDLAKESIQALVESMKSV